MDRQKNRWPLRNANCIQHLVSTRTSPKFFLAMFDPAMSNKIRKNAKKYVTWKFTSRSNHSRYRLLLLASITSTFTSLFGSEVTPGVEVPVWCIPGTRSTPTMVGINMHPRSKRYTEFLICDVIVYFTNRINGEQRDPFHGSIGKIVMRYANCIQHLVCQQERDT